MTEKLLTVGDVADQLSVNPETVRVWLRSGELPGFLLGDRAGWRVAPEELATFLADRRRGHGAVSAHVLPRRRAR